MSNQAVYTALKKLAAAYQEKLNQIPEALFQTTPAIGGWSYSEVYSHIIDLSILTLEEVKECINGEGEKDKPTAFLVKLLLFFGSLPPAVKYKVPKKLAARVHKITKAEASALITHFLAALDIVYPGLDQADLSIKTRHPRMGYFNAKQWFRFVEIHLKHHYKQLLRIEKSF